MVEFLKINHADSGATRIVAGIPGKKIRVLSYVLSASAAVNVKFQSDTVDKTGLLYFAAAGYGAVAPHNPEGWFECNKDAPLVINLSGAVTVGGHLSYEYV